MAHGPDTLMTSNLTELHGLLVISKTTFGWFMKTYIITVP